MRSNIARTWPASGPPEDGPGAGGSGDVARARRRAAVPVPAPSWAGIAGTLLQLPKEGDHGCELLGRQVLERRHGRGRVHERARDPLARQPRRDMREIGSGTGVAVVAQLVARQAAAAGDHLLAGVVFGERGAAGLR